MLRICRKIVGNRGLLYLKQDSRLHGTWNDKAEKITVNFILRDGSKKSVKAPLGTNILEAAHHYDINLEGACDASLACSTCHVIVNEKYFEKIPAATDREEDLLDLAPALEDTSRLGCQIILTKDLDGITVKLPHVTRNYYVDGHIPKPH